VKPEFALNLYYFQLYYSHSIILHGNEKPYYNKGSNISITIPVYSSLSFKKFKDKKNYTFGGIFNKKNNPSRMP